MKEKLAPHDPALPGLEELVSPKGLPRFADEVARDLGLEAETGRAQVDYVRYRPGLRCNVLWSMPGRTGRPVLVTGTLLSEEGVRLRAGNPVFQRLANGASEARSAYLPSRRILLQVFPSDIWLPGLQAANSPDWGLALMGSRAAPGASMRITPWRYRPQLSCVLEYAIEGGGETRYFAKVYRDERHRIVQSALEQLRGKDAGWHFAPAVAYDAEARVVVSQAIEGATVAEKLEAAPEDEDVKAQLLTQIRRIAELLPALQSTAIAGLTRFGPEETLAALRERVRRVAVVAPHQGELLTSLCAELEDQLGELEDEPLVTAHGAFRDSQVLVAEGEPVVLDLDGLRLSGASVDAGTFLASLDRIAVCRRRHAGVAEACAATFEDIVRGQPSYASRWLAWHRALGIAKKALQSLSSLDARWPERIEALAERAHQVLAGAPAHSKVS